VAHINNWEVITGCDRLSEGCNSCPSYWEHKEKGKDYSVVEHPELLDEPLLNPEPSLYDVAFGSDMFHGQVTLDFQKKVFDVMNAAHWHRFMVTSKRIGRARIHSSAFKWTDNIVMVVPVESGKYEWRIDLLKTMPAKTKVVSVVPMLGPFSKDLDLTGIDAVGAQQETWGYKRFFDPKWKEDLYRQCLEQEISFGDGATIYIKEGQKKYAIQ
jgi:protein gp37